MLYSNSPNNMSVKPPIRDLYNNDYLSVKVTLDRCILKTDSKFSRDHALLTSAGNLFHKVRAATLNVQSPYDLSRDTGTCNGI